MRPDLSPVFIPGRLAGSEVFWIGLGFLAFFDAIRLSLLPIGGFVPWLLVLFFTLIALQNRLRAQGRSVAMAFGVIVAAIAVKMVASFLATVFALYPDFMAFLQAQGVDINDPQAMNAAAYNPQFQQIYAEHLQSNPDLVRAISTAGGWPSMWGYWLVIGLVARRFDALRSA